MAPPLSRAKSEVRILHREASHGIAFVGRTLVVLWEAETRARAVAELAARLPALAAESGSLALLQVIGDHALPPDGAARAALAALLKANDTRLVVFEGTGFRASVIRSVVIGISMLSRPKFPHTVFASTTAGVEWLSNQLGDSPRHVADDRRLAIDRLRTPAVST